MGSSGQQRGFEWRESAICLTTPGTKKPRISGASLEAAEGTRTLDLLHGKQTL